MKVIMILGRAATGKDFLSFNLLKNGDYYKAVSFTTRKKREKEIEGKDYYYISDARFEEMRSQNQFLETTSYKVGSEIWKYGYTLDSFNKEKTNLVVCNPEGFRILYKRFKELNIEVKIILLCASLETRERRYFNRDINATKGQWNDRMNQDNKDFDLFEPELLKLPNSISIENNEDNLVVIKNAKNFLKNFQK